MTFYLCGNYRKYKRCVPAFILCLCAYLAASSVINDINVVVLPVNLLQERNQLSIQLTNLQVDFDNINARLEEETENASSLRSQLQKAVADYQNLKSRFDKELLAKTEELEDLRFVRISCVFTFQALYVNTKFTFLVMLVTISSIVSNTHSTSTSTCTYVLHPGVINDDDDAL